MWGQGSDVGVGDGGWGSMCMCGWGHMAGGA